MKKSSIFICMFIIFGFFLAAFAYSQSLDQIKAEARAEVRREMEIEEPDQPVAQQKERTVKAVRFKPDLLQQLALIAMAIALIPATIAKVKGRSFIAWWVLGVLCFIVVFPISVYIRKIPKT